MPAEPIPEQKSAKGRKRATSQQDFPVAPFFPDNPALEQVMADWLAYKRERRELPKTASGMKKLVTQMRKNAGQYGVEALAAAVDESMSNDYQGIVWKLVPQKARELAGNGGGYGREGGRYANGNGGYVAGGRVGANAGGNAGERAEADENRWGTDFKNW